MARSGCLALVPSCSCRSKTSQSSANRRRCYNCYSTLQWQFAAPLPTHPWGVRLGRKELWLLPCAFFPTAPYSDLVAASADGRTSRQTDKLLHQQAAVLTLRFVASPRSWAVGWGENGRNRMVLCARLDGRVVAGHAADQRDRLNEHLLPTMGSLAGAKWPKRE